jgi:hypothetical protein
MVGGWGRERGVVETIIPIDVAPIIIAIIALSPLLFFLFSLHNKAARKFPTMNSNLSAQTSLEKSSVFVSCPPRPCKRSKAPKNPPPLSFFSGICQMLGVRTSSSCKGLSTSNTCQRRNSSSTKEGSFQSSSIS